MARRRTLLRAAVFGAPAAALLARATAAGAALANGDHVPALVVGSAARRPAPRGPRGGGRPAKGAPPPRPRCGGGPGRRGPRPAPARGGRPPPRRGDGGAGEPPRPGRQGLPRHAHPGPPLVLVA